MKVLIVGSSKLPIPAVKGGAVPNLIEQLIRQNETEKELELSCCSLYDPEAEQESRKYPSTKFIWAKKPALIEFMDKALTFVLSKVLRMKRLLSLSYLFQVIWLSFFVAGVLRKGSYDQVVFENSVPVLFSMKLWGNKKKYANRYHFHIHSVPRGYYGNAKVIRECKSLICISQYVADEMLKDPRLGVAPEKIRIMYNCIDTGIFSTEKNDSLTIREKYGIAPDKKIVLFVGRLCKEKGIVELLQAIRKLDRKDTVVLVVGSNFYKSGLVSAYEEYLHSLIEDMAERIFFTGYVDYWKIPDYYKTADLAVLPSMWDEPAGMTMVEAMACGMPLVTTVSGGIPEYVGEGNCLLVERDGDIVAHLAESIDDLLNDKEKAEAIGRKAADRAARYDLEFYYQQFMAILSEEV